MKWWLGALVLLLAGWVFRLGLLVYAMYAFLGVLWVSRVWSRRWTEGVSAERECPVAVAEIGDEAEVRLTLRNTGRRRIPWLLAEEGLPLDALRQVPPRLRAMGPRLAVMALRGGEARSLAYRLTFLMRGYYPIGPVLLESGDLFGLHRRFRLATEPSFVLVRPKVVALGGYDLASRRPIGEVRISHRLFEDPTRIRGVRPYERGDPLNRIHWRATARTGALHSRNFEPSCVAGATLLLDFHRDNYAPTRRAVAENVLPRAVAAQLDALAGDSAKAVEVPLVELAATTAASLANAVYELGQQVGLVSNGRDAADRIRAEGSGRQFRTRSVARAMMSGTGSNERLRPVTVETRRGAGQLLRILDTLGRLELTDGLDFAGLVDEARPHLPRDATVAAILTRVNDAAAIALGNLRRSGYAVTAILVSFEATEYHDWADAPDWAGRLLAEGVPFRRVQDEEDLSRLCAEHFVR